MRKSLSLEFTDPQEYIENLDHVNFSYSLFSEEEIAMHYSRIHVVNDSVKTFSDHEESTGFFTNERRDQKYFGLRFIRSGQECHSFNYQSIFLDKDECLFFDLSGKGGYRRLSRVEGINLLFPYKMLAAKLPNMEDFCMKLNCRQGLGKIMFDYTFSIEEQLSGLSEDDRVLIIDNYLEVLCQWLIQSENKFPNRHNTKVFAQIQDYISHHLSNETLNLSLVATEFNLSQRSIQKLFEEQGLTFSKYLTNERLRHAAQDLVNSHLTVTEIALKWAFCDTSYFCRKFKIKFGRTPSIYMKEYRSSLCGESIQRISCPLKK
ncbi:helix-turn-helix transcriptional regulator [Enterococcus malodoratus]|uniref:helix-turn-helix transcriptional regulator n=1 Tax=Enterococcus malodoratus TaxID=71451 RepID=UPI0039AEE48C